MPIVVPLAGLSVRNVAVILFCVLARRGVPVPSATMNDRDQHALF
jgi:hypothetical protein